jgi:endonuclease I
MMFRSLVFALILFCSNSLNAQIPRYYAEVDFGNKSEPVVDQLFELLTKSLFQYYPYTSSETDVWDVLRTSCADPENLDNVILVYGHDDTDEFTQNDRTRNIYSNQSGSCIGYWSREHVYPKSLANPSLITSFPGAGTDVHNLLPCDCQMNSVRSNRLFVSGSGNSGTSGNGFYPGDEWKGDVARILMYMHIRYPSQCNAMEVAEGEITYDTTYSSMPDLLLKWNVEDPVSDLEVIRNNDNYAFQGNRNPFIDNPYLATLIWGGPTAKDTWGNLNEKSYYKDLNAYPTICKNELFITNYFKEENIDYSIVNIDGDVVQTGKTTYSIPLNEQKAGTYVLKLGNDNSSKEITIYIQ